MIQKTSLTATRTATVLATSSSVNKLKNKLNILNELLCATPQTRNLTPEDLAVLRVKTGGFFHLPYGRSVVYALVIDYVNQHPREDIAALGLDKILTAKDITRDTKHYFEEIHTALVQQRVNTLAPKYQAPLRASLEHLGTKIANFVQQQEQSKKLQEQYTQDLVKLTKNYENRMVTLKHEIASGEKNSANTLKEYTKISHERMGLRLSQQQNLDSQVQIGGALKNSKEEFRAQLNHEAEAITDYYAHDHTWVKMTEIAANSLKTKIHQLLYLTGDLQKRQSDVLEALASASKEPPVSATELLQELKERSIKLKTSLNHRQQLPDDDEYTQAIASLTQNPAQLNPLATKLKTDPAKAIHHYKKLLDQSLSEKECLAWIIVMVDKIIAIATETMHQQSSYQSQLGALQKSHGQLQLSIVEKSKQMDDLATQDHDLEQQLTELKISLAKNTELLSTSQQNLQVKY